MDLQFSEQQTMLREAVERYLERELTFEARRHHNSPSEILAFWNKMDLQLGIANAGLAEELGGFGGGSEAEMIVSQALGSALAVTPFIDCNVLSATLLQKLDQSDMLAKLAKGGELIVTAVEEAQTRGDIAKIECWADPVDGGWRLTGQKLVVNFAAEASTTLIPARISDGDYALFALPASLAHGAMHPFRLIDDTPSADLVFDALDLPGDTLLAHGDRVLEAIGAAVDRATSALCAEAAGLAATMVADTVAYAKEREQFGMALASFQALQHRMVDMYLKSEELAAAALLAALRCDRPDAVSAAKVTAAENLRHIGQEAVQLHGAMGLTEELRIGHYFKRATVLESRLGGTDRHVERFRKLRLAN